MYKPNFCADCGEKIERNDWQIWTSTRFCENCEQQLEPWQKKFLIPLFIGTALLSVGVLIGRTTQERKPQIVVSSNQAATSGSNVQTSSRPNAQPSATPANRSDQAARAQLRTNAARTNQPQQQTIIAPTSPPSEQLQSTEGTYFCGARTKKGTPCSRRVKGGGRCWQHIGKPPMLPEDKLLIH